MANFKISFLGTERSNTDEHELQCYHSIFNEIFIDIDMMNGYSAYICLDKQTAIKFHKELKKQISYMQEGVCDE